MKQIVIVSGKGGTGKTVLTASFAVLAKRSVIADCDVDAADLHLLLHPRVTEKHEFQGLTKAHIDEQRCPGCGECLTVCRFGAVRDGRYQMVDGRDTDGRYSIDPIACEGCRVCSYLCPPEAIRMVETIAGEWYVSETRYGPMVHAQLGIAQENSGKLVAVVRQQAKLIAEKNNLDCVVIDGPPGIGCPVIASLSGVDMALVVTEPTLSGIHDLERVTAVARHFGITSVCVINKFDINRENSNMLEHWCQSKGMPLAGRIPFDSSVMESIIEGVPFVEYTNNSVSREITRIWHNLTKQ